MLREKPYLTLRKLLILVEDVVEVVAVAQDEAVVVAEAAVVAEEAVVLRRTLFLPVVVILMRRLLMELPRNGVVNVDIGLGAIEFMALLSIVDDPTLKVLMWLTLPLAEPLLQHPHQLQLLLQHKMLLVALATT